jgi:ankyrin repeat protein
LKYNANSNLTENVSGWNALMLACRNEHRENVEMLLKNNSNVNSFGSNGTTPLMIGKKNLFK